MINFFKVLTGQKDTKNSNIGVTYTNPIITSSTTTTAINFPSINCTINYPDISVNLNFVTFYFEKGTYTIPLSEVKKYGYRISIMKAYMLAENLWKYSLASTWIPSKIKYTLPSTIGTMSWTTTSNTSLISGNITT